MANVAGYSENPPYLRPDGLAQHTQCALTHWRGIWRRG